MLNNEPSVREATRLKVMEAMNMLRYRPSQSAKAMAEKRSTISLGVLYRYSSGGFFSELIKGIEQGLEKFDCLMLASRLKKQPTSIEEIETYIKQSGVQALIILYPEMSNDFLDHVNNFSFPIIIIGESTQWGRDNVHQVVSTSSESIHQMIQHMQKKYPKRETVILRGPHDNMEASERLERTLDALNQHGAGQPTILNGDFQSEISTKALKKWAKNNDASQPINMICHNDSMALSALSFFHDQGRRIPQDVSLCGFDDIESSKIFGLSTVRVLFEEMGEKAAEMAIKLIRYEKMNRISEVETELILRKTM